MTNVEWHLLVIQSFDIPLLPSTTEVERQWEIGVGFFVGQRERAGGVTVGDESCHAARFGFEGVDGEGFMAQATGMGHVVLAAPE